MRLTTTPALVADYFLFCSSVWILILKNVSPFTYPFSFTHPFLSSQSALSHQRRLMFSLICPWGVSVLSDELMSNTPRG